MNTKVAVKSKTLTPFGGIFYVLDEFSRLGLFSVIDLFPGLRCKTIGYQYSEIISSLFCIYYCGGDCIEDIFFALYQCIFASILIFRFLPMRKAEFCQCVWQSVANSMARCCQPNGKTLPIQWQMVDNAMAKH